MTFSDEYLRNLADSMIPEGPLPEILREMAAELLETRKLQRYYMKLSDVCCCAVCMGERRPC